MILPKESAPFSSCRFNFFRLAIIPNSRSDVIGDPTVDDAILDRIAHSAHSIELTGESVRKIKASAK